MSTRRYAVVIEKAARNFAAYMPDLPGCAATGKTVVETEADIRGAIQLHLQAMIEDGVTLPKPASRVEYIEIPA